MRKQTKQAIVLAGVGLLALTAMVKRSKAKKSNDVNYELEGKGWQSMLKSIDSWLPNAKGRNKPQARAAFLKEALPESVTYEDYLKFANGAPFGGGYTQQDRMLLGDTFS